MSPSEELLSRCWEIFGKMTEFYNNHRDSSTGFNFSYSPEQSWAAMPHMLLLTHHPWPQEDDELKPNPDSPWPARNAFFDSSHWNTKRLWTFAERILTIAAEIAACEVGIHYKASMENNTELEDFVNANMVLASFVPFRTKTPTEEDIHFSKEQYWSPIVELWQPELIIAAGDYPFGHMEEVLKQSGWHIREITEEPTWKFGTRINKDVLRSNGTYKIHVCAKEPAGKKIYVLSVPSPSANFGDKEHHESVNYGYPDPTLYIPNKAPIQDFIGKALWSIGRQRRE